MPTAYEKQVSGYTKLLRSSDVKKRRKAAMMVGELGAAETITILVKMLKHDKDGQVRENARYALGMFAAFRDAIQAGGTLADEAVENVQRVVDTGTIGARARLSPSVMRSWMLRLGIVLIVLLMLNGGIYWLNQTDQLDSLLAFTQQSNNGTSGSNTPVPTFPTPTPVPDKGINTLIQEGITMIGLLRLNANTLQQQYGPALSGGEPAECNAPYDESIQRLGISPADAQTYPRVAEIFGTLNDSLFQLNEAKERMNEACFDSIPLSVDETNLYVGNLVAFQTSAIQFESELNAFIPLPTETPLPPTETPIPADLRPYVAELFNIIDGVMGGRGTGTLLSQYWQEAATIGQTDGCRNTALIVPNEYNLPADASLASPVLVDATAQINAGLRTLQDSLTAFYAACALSQDTVRSNSSIGISATDAVRVAFENASNLLNTVLANQ
ncbi:MAG: HEAT repeat domain-containing protein [Phototrophicaceae bacterium]